MMNSVWINSTRPQGPEIGICDLHNTYICIFNDILLNEKISILIFITIKCFLKDPVNDKLASV